MIWACLSVRMYSTSRCTLVRVLVALITCFEMNFMATLWPVTVCIATESRAFVKKAGIQEDNGTHS